jgi:hypothetical protein
MIWWLAVLAVSGVLALVALVAWLAVRFFCGPKWFECFMEDDDGDC